MNQRYGKSILLSFHDQQQNTDVKQDTAYIIEEGNAILQTSHKHGIDDMQQDRQTDQVAINIIAVIVLIKFHPHARNPPIFPFPAVKQAVDAAFTALCRTLYIWESIPAASLSDKA